MKSGVAPQESAPPPQGLCLVLLDGAVKIEISGELMAAVSSALRGGIASAPERAATYDAESSDLPMSKRRFRQGCRERWWRSWKGRNGRLMAAREEVDRWVREHRALDHKKQAADTDEDDVTQVLLESGLRPRAR